MASKRVKVKEHENLSDSNIIKVISLLEADKPITKKEACEILNISYNTTRLSNIVEGYKAKKAIEKKQRDKKRGTSATKDEIQEIVKNYLEGMSVADIAKGIFRSSTFVSSIVTKLGVPTRVPFEQRRNPAILPDECIAEEFTPGQRAWSAVYHSPCEVIKEVANKNYESEYQSRCYQIYVYEPIEEVEFITTVTKGGYYAYSLAYNLGSLEHLKDYGVTL